MSYAIYKGIVILYRTYKELLLKKEQIDNA
jgi:hypothetical protein